MAGRPRRLADLLPALLASWQLDTAYRVTCLWPQVAGEAVARVSRPHGIRQNVLLVEVESPSWAQELAMLRVEFLDRYRQLLPDVPLDDIRFQARSWFEEQGRDTVSDASSPVSDRAATTAAPLLSLTPREVAALEEQLQTVPEDIRPAMRTMISHEARLAKTRLRAGWQPCSLCRALHPGAERLCRLCQVTQST